MLEKRPQSSDWKMNIQFDYMFMTTPHQNHLVELVSAFLANKRRTMMHRTNLDRAMQYKLFTKAFATEMLLDGLSVVEIIGAKKLCFKYFAGVLPKFAKHLCTWGDASTIKTHKKRSPKINDYDMACMMFGYTTSHEGDCYKMYHPIKWYVYKSRDVIWLKRMYYPKPVSQDELDNLLPWLVKQDPDSTEAVTADQGGNKKVKKQQQM
eukprot:4553888-Ditylum_brightwellii.AAC.1